MNETIEMMPDVFKRFSEFRFTEMPNLYNYLPMFNQIEQMGLRQNLKAVEWARGYVKHVHTMMLTSGIGKTALNVIVEKMIGEGINLTGSESAEFFHDELGHEELDETIHELCYTTLEYGGSCARLLFEGDDAKIQIAPLGTYKATRYFNGDIKDIEVYLNIKGATKQFLGYVLIEYRFYNDRDGKPYIKYKVAQLNHNQHSNSVERVDIDLKTSTDANSIKQLYSDIDFDTEIEITQIDTLGVQIFKATKFNSNFRDLDFGDALLMGAYDILFSNDHSFTNMESDKFIGQGTVILPAHFQGSKLQGYLSASENYGVSPDTVKVVEEMIQGYKEPVKFGKKFYAEAPGLDPEKQKPLIVQFDLRTDQHEKSMNLSTRLLARFLRISACDLDTALSGQTGEARTATEATIEHSLGMATINAKRKLITPNLKKLLMELAQAKNITLDELNISWSSLAIARLDEVLRQIDYGIISKEDARKMLHPTMTRRQNEEIVARIEDEASRITEETAFEFVE